MASDAAAAVAAVSAATDGVVQVEVGDVHSPARMMVAPKRSKNESKHVKRVKKIEKQIHEESKWDDAEDEEDEDSGGRSWLREGATVAVKDDRGVWRRGTVDSVNFYEEGRRLAHVFLVDVGVAIRSVDVKKRIRKLADPEWAEPKHLAKELVLYGERKLRMEAITTCSLFFYSCN